MKTETKVIFKTEISLQTTVIPRIALEAAMDRTCL